MTGSPYPAPCLVPENLPTAFLLPMPPVFGTVLACLLPDKPVFRPLDHHEPFRHGAHTRRAERAADLSAGLPVGTLRPCLTSAVDQPRAASRPSFSSFPAKGRPVLPSCLGCWFSWPWCRTGAAFWAWWWCHPARLAAPRQRVMAAGHPFIGRGSRPKVGGTPKGCPGRRPLAAFRFAQVVELPTGPKVLKI